MQLNTSRRLCSNRNVLVKFSPVIQTGASQVDMQGKPAVLVAHGNIEYGFGCEVFNSESKVQTPEGRRIRSTTESRASIFGKSGGDGHDASASVVEGCPVESLISRGAEELSMKLGSVPASPPPVKEGL